MKLFKSKHISEYSDNELLFKYKKSTDNKYVGELYKRYSHLVYGVCLKYFKNEDESKDAVIDIFENLLDDLLKHDVENFKGWLHSVARNHCLMVLRKRQTVLKKENLYQSQVKAEQVSEINPFENTEDSAIEKEQLLTNLEKGIAQLKEEQKICIQLFFIEQKCYNEVAESTGFTLKQVKSHIQNGKRNLTMYMTQKS